MTAFMVVYLPVRTRKLSWRPARDASVSSELPRSDAGDWRPARRVVDAWEQLRSLALRAARGRRVVARALPKGLPLAVAVDFASDFSHASRKECIEHVGSVLDCRRRGCSPVYNSVWAPPKFARTALVCFHRAGRTCRHVCVCNVNERHPRRTYTLIVSGRRAMKDAARVASAPRVAQL